MFDFENKNIKKIFDNNLLNFYIYSYKNNINLHNKYKKEILLIIRNLCSQYIYFHIFYNIINKITIQYLTIHFFTWLLLYPFKFYLYYWKNIKLFIIKYITENDGYVDLYTFYLHLKIILFFEKK